MTQLFKNFARSTLAGSITNVAGSLTVQPGDADKFPVVAGSDFFLAAIVDVSGNAELVKCTARTGGSNTLTVTRAQEGTTALAFAAGSFIFHGPTAADIQNCLNGVFASLTIAGALTTGSFSAAGKAVTAPVDVTTSATPTIDASLSNVFQFATALGAHVTACTINNPTPGQTIQIRVQQDATGGRTFAAPTGAKVSGSIDLTASRVSHLTLTYYGTVGGVAVNRWEGGWSTVPA